MARRLRPGPSHLKVSSSAQVDSYSGRQESVRSKVLLVQLSEPDDIYDLNSFQSFVMHDAFGCADAARLCPHHGTDQPLCGEQRHLRVASDPPCPSVMRRQLLRTPEKRVRICSRCQNSISAPSASPMAPPIRQAGSSSHHPCLFPSCVSRQQWTKVTVVRGFVPLIAPSMAVKCPGARLRGTSCGIALL